MDLYNTHRPKKLEDIQGQDAAIKIIKGWKTIPQAIMLIGPSGTGKTTLARIIRRLAKCHKDDFTEINCADYRGVDKVRELTHQCKLGSLASGVNGKRVYLIDEVQGMTGDAQNAFLKTLEEPPRHVIFILATTDPVKIKSTIKSRCATIALKLLAPAAMRKAVERVAKLENFKLHDKVYERIQEAAEGCPRKAITLLANVLGIKDKESQIEAIIKSDSETIGFDIARLLFDTRTTWAQVRPKLKDIDEEPETVRRIIMKYMTSVMLGDKSNNFTAKRAAGIINLFRDPYFDAGQGKAMLLLNCFEVLGGR